MTLRNLALAGCLTALSGLASCVSETITSIRTVRMSFQPIGIHGEKTEEIISYKNQKIQIATITNKNNKYCLIFAPENPDLINYICKNYNIQNMFFVTSRGIKEVKID